ncbi:MAG: hypothetical protein EZS28_006225 [Streblomastix strix]|uniref:Uncharacterized protein n=1 Tax=Streblomastix strix TaxID=222440 RepID=A0A5J4WV68_9EUKA|nr:MAG: hypothetical protein EZS28_006225 [Streblomastix strix]
MFQCEFMRDIKSAHWWSDGEPHFRNRQVIWQLLNLQDPLLPGINFEINFLERYHGKGAPDRILALYSTGLQWNKPKEGIQSLSALATELRLLSLQQAMRFNDESRNHDIIIFNIDKFDQIADILDMERFKQFLSYLVRDWSIVARPLTGVGNIEERIFEMVSSERAVRGTPKRSTVAMYDQ